MKIKNNKWGFTMIEIIVVVSILIGLMAWLALWFSGQSSKAQDTLRVNIIKDYTAYMTEVKKNLGQYPWNNWHSRGTTQNRKILDYLPMTNNSAVLTFDDFDPTTGYYVDANLNWFQQSLVSAWVIGDPGEIKKWVMWENVALFVSPTKKRMVMCAKLYNSNEASINDWDGIPDSVDTKDPTLDSSVNGSRILVQWDMWLWKKNQAAFSTVCKNLIDPRSL